MIEYVIQLLSSNHKWLDFTNPIKTHEIALERYHHSVSKFPRSKFRLIKIEVLKESK